MTSTVKCLEDTDDDKMPAKSFQRMKRGYYIWLLLTIVWFCLITFLSHQDEIHSTSFSLSIVDSTVSIKELFGDDMDITEDERWSMNLLLRKIAHLGAFGGLSFLLFMTLHTGEYTMIPGGVFCMMWSVLDELIKPLSPGRHANGTDILLNLIGTVIGILVWALIMRLKTDKLHMKVRRPDAPF